MNFNELVVDNLGQINLSQKKFAKGALIATGLKEDKGYVAIDIRFYFEKENGWLPTRNGFWVAKENWAVLQKILSGHPEDMGEIECWRTSKRKFIIRYVPKYGGGIDFRYYSQNDKYTGWEKKGIWIAKRDYANVKTLIFDAIEGQSEIEVSKEIKVIHTDRAKRQYKSKKKSDHDCNNYGTINPALMEILGG